MMSESSDSKCKKIKAEKGKEDEKESIQVNKDNHSNDTATVVKTSKEPEKQVNKNTNSSSENEKSIPNSENFINDGSINAEENPGGTQNVTLGEKQSCNITDDQHYPEIKYPTEKYNGERGSENKQPLQSVNNGNTVASEDDKPSTIEFVEQEGHSIVSRPQSTQAVGYDNELQRGDKEKQGEKNVVRAENESHDEITSKGKMPSQSSKPDNILEGNSHENFLMRSEIVSKPDSKTSAECYKSKSGSQSFKNRNSIDENEGNMHLRDSEEPVGKGLQCEIIQPPEIYNGERGSKNKQPLKSVNNGNTVDSEDGSPSTNEFVGQEGQSIVPRPQSTQAIGYDDELQRGDKWKQVEKNVVRAENDYVLWQDRSFWVFIFIQSILTSILTGFVITNYQQLPTTIVNYNGKDHGPLFKAVHLKMDALKTGFKENAASLQTENEELKKRITEIEKSMKYLKDIVPKVDAKLNWMEQEHSEINSYIIGFLLLIIVCLMWAAYWIVLGRKSSKSSSRLVIPNNCMSGVSTKPSILDQIKQKPLLNNIGMVGFNKDTHTLHESLVDAVKKHCGIQIEVSSTVVPSAEVIPQIPASRVIFIFVDFNDRNIILEDPDTEIGDLRRMTTECIMKMGCFAYVVYVGDVYSKQLPDHQLYNSGLHSIKRHKLLSELQRNNQVLSVNKAFNKCQLESISTVLNWHLSF